MERRIFLGGAAVVVVPSLSGCAASSQTISDDAYCYRAHGRPRTQVTCSPDAIPTASEDAEAKRFAVVPGELVVYVVRNRVGDTVNSVNVGLLGGRLVATVPASMVRLVLPPGAHRLALEWKLGSGGLSIDGAAGQVLFVELVGNLWLWRNRYRLVMAEPSIQQRALRSRLVGDIKAGEGR